MGQLDDIFRQTPPGEHAARKMSLFEIGRGVDEDAAALVDRGRDESPENDAEREARIGTSKSVA